ncbi:transmembrane protein 59 [Electrophorus electricus]|uniref:Transmembrane protein 59 n=1 Tax=Electrophorus electricus TaxID=8005 RepID=A0A4W4EZ17_ELEEL|nr:transmembrane protein 59 [Electrophorus electricus]
MHVIKSYAVLLSFIYVFYSCSTSADVFDGVLGNTASCHKTCQMTYSLHTYPREEELYACQRGCRLFSICQFVGDTENLNQTKSECYSACHEAYNQADEQYACSLGCQSQLPFAEQRQEKLLAMMPRIHLLYPLTLVRGFWDDVMSQAHSFITSSWTFYLQADDGKVVVFQTAPQVQFVPEYELQREELKEEPQRLYHEISDPVYKDYDRSYIQERVMSMDQSNSDDDYNFFNCLSRNPWLPGWILTTTLVLSVLVLIWICCATVATAVDQYVPAEKLSIYGDSEYMKDQKLTPYPQSTLVIISSGGKDDEAGPLPSKVKLDQSTI